MRPLHVQRSAHQGPAVVLPDQCQVLSAQTTQQAYMAITRILNFAVVAPVADYQGLLLEHG